MAMRLLFELLLEVEELVPSLKLLVKYSANLNGVGTIPKTYVDKCCSTTLVVRLGICSRKTANQASWKANRCL